MWSAWRWVSAALLRLESSGPDSSDVSTSIASSRTCAPSRAASGLGAFLYLNLLDASFSLDGVIGAFALTNKLIIIALGLTIGAVFVRAMTMAMVESGTLARYRFLEHGAFWAILALGGCLLASARVEVPEALTGLTGAVLIGAAIWSSARRAQ